MASNNQNTPNQVPTYANHVKKTQNSGFTKFVTVFIVISCVIVLICCGLIALMLISKKGSNDSSHQIFANSERSGISKIFRDDDGNVIHDGKSSEISDDKSTDEDVKTDEIKHDKTEPAEDTTEDESGTGAEPADGDEYEPFTLYFDACGGEVDLTTEYIVSYHDTYGSLPTPEREGYSFDGWYESEYDGTEITRYTIVTETSSHTLYAHWTANTYTVYFDANGGDAYSTSKSVTYDRTYGALTYATRSGYTFVGWYTAPSGGFQVTEDSYVTLSQDHTLYAQWSTETYTVSFNANGGKTTTSSKTVAYGSTYGTLPTPTRAGYTFVGWFTSVSGGTKIVSSTPVNLTSDQTLFAHWSTSGFTVTFNANGGSTPTSSKTVTYGSTYGTLPTPTRTGYIFTGWYTATSGGTHITSSTTVALTSNQTLYAQWSTSGYTVTFNANGGSTSTSSKIVSFGSTYGSLPIPTRTGYSFVGWYTATSGGTLITSSSTVVITSNQTLYAVWNANSYTVNFNANGGTLYTYSKTVYYGSSYGTLPSPTRAGYNFNGWYTATSGGTRITEYSTVYLTSNQTLYAQWGTNSCTVTFDAVGGTTPTSSKSVTSGSTYGTLPVPTKEGHTFVGWYTAAYGGTVVTENTAVASSSSHTLYAHWNVKQYMATWTTPGMVSIHVKRTSSKYADASIGYITSGSTVYYGDVLYVTYSADYGCTISSHGPNTINVTQNVTSKDIYVVVTTSSGSTVSFDANGGSVYPLSMRVVYNSPYGSLPIPTRPGYSFDGWYTSPYGGSFVTERTIVTNSSNHTLYAHWREN